MAAMQLLTIGRAVDRSRSSQCAQTELAADLTVEQAAADRRCPGRVAYLNPHLIAMLRRRISSATKNTRARVDIASDTEIDGLIAARGIALAILISAVFWAAVAGGPSLLAKFG
jgi:hypothetical protein